MNSNQAKKIQLFDLLENLGFHPKDTRYNGNEVWYISPLRPNEKTASFKIKLDENIWFDHGEGVGGNILDFVMKYRHTDFRGALSFLERGMPGRGIATGVKLVSPASNASLFDYNNKKESVPVIKEVKPVFSYALKNYIQERAIEQAVAYRYLKEIRYLFEDKEYFALGFPNRVGGWELRSSVYKGVVGEKDISVITNGSDKVSCFEGFMDFLSAVTLNKENLQSDIVVLNSTAMKKAAVEFIKSKGYREVNTFFDNDPAGEKTNIFFESEMPGSIKRRNAYYQEYQDLNDLLMKNSKTKNDLSKTF